MIKKKKFSLRGKKFSKAEVDLTVLIKSTTTATEWEKKNPEATREQVKI